MIKIYEANICGDCVEAAANGLDSFAHPDPTFAERFEENADAKEGASLEPGHVHNLEDCGRQVMEGSADCPFDEGGFSWSSCDWCRSQLGGQRYPAAIIYRKDD